MAALVRLLRGAAEQEPRGDGARRAAAELGVLAGLEVLAGEPVVVLLTAVIAAARFAAHGARRRAGVPLAQATVIALLVAAPQIAATAQILPDSSRARTPFPFVVATGTSTHPVRLVEQVVPFPYGRPDLFGRFGFDAHEVFDHHAPYLWTLHLGLPVIGLLVLFGRPSSRHEAIYAALALVAVVLAFGRNLPGAKELYPLLSLDGRIRLPVKWWYVVALALVPLVASAAARWQGGQPLSGARRLLGFILLAGSGLVLAWQWPETMLASAGPALSLALLALLVFDRTPRRLAAAACVLACALLLCHAPLLLALLDRPPEASPVGGATFPSGTIRGFYRRGPTELWPLLASAGGTGYAFDEDPDGAYADEDRAIRKALDDMPWAERAAELRIAGVTGIVTDEMLGEPYREVRVLNERQAVRLYALEQPSPSVRFATRIVTRHSLDAVLASHRSADFDPATDVVLETAVAAAGERIAWWRASTHPPPASSCGRGHSSRPGGRQWTPRPPSSFVPTAIWWACGCPPESMSWKSAGRLGPWSWGPPWPSLASAWPPGCADRGP
jgi:hypothetical protein